MPSKRVNLSALWLQQLAQTQASVAMSLWPRCDGGGAHFGCLKARLQKATLSTEAVYTQYNRLIGM